MTEQPGAQVVMFAESVPVAVVVVELATVVDVEEVVEVDELVVVEPDSVVVVDAMVVVEPDTLVVLPAAVVVVDAWPSNVMFSCAPSPARSPYVR